MRFMRTRKNERHRSSQAFFTQADEPALPSPALSKSFHSTGGNRDDTFQFVRYGRNSHGSSFLSLNILEGHVIAYATVHCDSFHSISYFFRSRRIHKFQKFAFAAQHSSIASRAKLV